MKFVSVSPAAQAFETVAGVSVVVKVDRNTSSNACCICRACVAHPIVAYRSWEAVDSIGCQEGVVLATHSRRCYKISDSAGIAVARVKGIRAVKRAEEEPGRSRVAGKIYDIERVATTIPHRKGYSLATGIRTGERVNRVLIVVVVRPVQEDDVAAVVVDNGIRTVARAELKDVCACAALQAIVALSALKDAVRSLARQPVVVIRSLDILDGEEDVAYGFVVVGAKAVRSVEVDLRACARNINPDPFARVFVEGCVIVIAADERVCARTAVESAHAILAILAAGLQAIVARSALKEVVSLIARKPVVVV